MNDVACPFRPACAIALLGVGTLLGSLPQTLGQVVPEPSSLVTNLAQLAALPEDVLRKGRTPVRLQGVLSWVGSDRRVFVQDGSLTAIADFISPSPNHKPGERVEISGWARYGYPMPLISAREIRVLAEEPPPAPKRADPARLAAGEDALSVVLLGGKVRDIQSLGNSFVKLLVSDRGVAYTIILTIPKSWIPPGDWLDAEIEARGLVAPTPDNLGRAVGFTLHVNSTNFLTVRRPGTSNLFERPLLPIRAAMEVTDTNQPRLKITGTVLAHVPGKTLFVEDETGVMRVTLLTPLPSKLIAVTRTLDHQEQTQLQPGEQVEVLGAPLQGRSLTPGLEDGEFRRIGRAAAAPRPQPVSLRDLEAGKFPGRLVTLTARLLDQRAFDASGNWHHWLVLERDGRVFQARWEGETPATWNLPADSYFQVTGVNDAEVGDLRKARSFQLVLRSPTDVVPTAAPPAWTRPEVRRVSAAVAAVVLLAAGWITYQRRQMRRVRASDEVARRAEVELRKSHQDLERRIADRTTELRVANEQLTREIGDRTRAEKVQRALYAISEAIHSVEDLTSLYERLNEIIGTLMPARNFYIALYDATTDMVSFPYHRDEADAPPPPRKARRGMTEYVLRTGRAALADLDEIARLKAAGEYIQSGAPAKIWLGVPLASGGRPFGVMAVQDHHDARVYGEEEKQILSFVAGQTALAIQRKRAEHDLRVALAAEKELNQLKSSFVSMVSHEFRTPLEVILSSSNILDRYLDRLPPEKRATQLRAIRKSVHRMNDLIDDVLMLGKLDAGAMSCQTAPVDLAAFCRRAMGEIESATARDGVIQFTAAEMNGDAAADEGLLQHILANILGNAVKYSPPGQPVEFRLTRRGTDAEFVIRDHGCGIPAADQARLFTAFYRGSNVGQKPGSGLGLVIAKRCVDLHGGSIRCESEEGKGTTFIVTLPLFDGTRMFPRRANGKPQDGQPQPGP